MPKLTASHEEIKGQPPMAEGLYTIKLKGFKPQLSRKKDSVNLNPEIVIINHAEHNDRRVFDSLNTKAKWAWKDFCGCFGVPCVEDASGGIEFPGEFAGPENDPEKWQYVGPLLGQTGQAYLIQVQVLDTNGNPSTDKQGNTHRNQVKYYVNQLQASAVGR